MGVFVDGPGVLDVRTPVSFIHTTGDNMLLSSPVKQQPSCLGAFRVLPRTDLRWGAPVHEKLSDLGMHADARSVV